VFALLGGYAAYNLITTEHNYSAARNEYTELRRMYAPFSDTDDGGSRNPGGNTGAESDAHLGLEAMPDLTEINPDYIGWLRINGTDIDYPMVKGNNNSWYLNHTFSGERNPSGTIFMDTRSNKGFEGFALLHGHNMRDGSMFAGLHDYLDDGFRNANSEVIVFTPGGDILIYSIFSAEITDVNDEAFLLPEKSTSAIPEFLRGFDFSPNELENVIDILALSTCTFGHRNERLVVLAYRSRA